MSIKLVRAEEYSIQELTDAYNQTRVDYMVPMRMDTSKLAEYVQVYDIDLNESLVAQENENIVGLGMLGLRPNRAWITRLGMVANRRGSGIGKTLLKGLLANSDSLNIPQVCLEVIKGNKPAHALFLKLGFQDVRELVILRRPAQEAPKPQTRAYPMDITNIIHHLNERAVSLAWTNQPETLHQIRGMAGFQLQSQGEVHAWMVFHRNFSRISRLIFGTKHEDPVFLMRELLAHLHTDHPDLDTYAENIPADDPHLPAFKELGYTEVFRRVEMHRYRKTN